MYFQTGIEGAAVPLLDSHVLAKVVFCTEMILSAFFLTLCIPICVGSSLLAMASVRRERLESIEVFKIDVVEARLRGAGPVFGGRSGAIGSDCGRTSRVVGGVH